MGSPSPEKGNLPQPLKACPDDIVPDLESKKKFSYVSVAGNIVSDQITGANTVFLYPLQKLLLA